MDVKYDQQRSDNFKGLTMSVTNPVNTTNNETRVETIGNTSITFEKISNKWMVSSLEIHRVFKADTTMYHGTMIRDFQNRKGYEGEWERCISASKITSRDYNVRGKLNDEFMFSRDAFFFYVMTMNTPKSVEFKWAFISRYDELENMVACVARGEINLQDDAIELVNNMVGNDEVANMCDFSQYISSHRSGVSMSNQKLYTILRDMQFIYKDRNCSTVLGSPYLTTVIDKVYLTSSIKPYKETFPALLNKIVTFLEKSDHPLKECVGIHSSVNLVDNIEFCKLPTKDDPTYIVDEDSKVKFMDGLGLKQQYDKVNKGLEKFDLAVSAKAMELTIDNDIDYEVKILIPSHHPKDSTPTIKDGVCIGYTKTIPGGSITWND